MRTRGRVAAAAALLAAALQLGGCFRYVAGLGKVSALVSPSDSLELRLVLIGDAGLPAPGGEPVMKALQTELSYDPKYSFVVFLGDNVYPRGMVRDSTAAERRENERIINDQLAPLIATGVPGIMLPGNHDWATGTAAGWDAIRAEERYVNARGHGLVKFLPEGGCPGPEVVDVGDYVRLIVLDTQWWLQAGYPRPYGPSAGSCRARTEQEVVDSLRADLASAGQRRTVVLSHHPLVSGGQHGGYFDWPTYLFPLHPWARQAGAFARQDVSGREYRGLIAAMVRAFQGNTPLIHAAGHEHNLQLLRGVGAHYQVISGAGIYNHTTPVRVISGTLYARRASGWTTIAFLRDGRVRMAYRTVDAEGKITEEFSMWLDTPPLVLPPPPVAVDSTGAPIPAPEAPPTAPAPSPPPAPAPAPTPMPTPPPPPAPAPPGARP